MMTNERVGMNGQETLSPMRAWLTEPLSGPVVQSVQRLRRADDICHVALMPDVHLAKDVCIGAVIATRRLIYPMAIGGDIGCGMAALAFEAEASLVDNSRVAASLLSGLYEQVPSNKHRSARSLPESLGQRLSDSSLAKRASRDGRIQLGTMGRGNHFLELQADQQGQLWLMVHSGSRAMGQIITAYHMRRATRRGNGLPYLDATEEAGAQYLADLQWARAYARENRMAMLLATADLLSRHCGVHAAWETLIHADHNHVRQETHFGESLWVHRKGAQSAAVGEPGVIPGSMGSPSMHTTGRGCEDALRSCSHGAGRRMSRSEARQKVSRSEFVRQVGHLWFDRRRADPLRDEAPSAYRDIRAVMRAQRQLTKTVRELSPILNYKAT